ncbi:MAG: hypothetical protein AMXMBFR64_49550 [Myxococcales bacterium]
MAPRTVHRTLLRIATLALAVAATTGSTPLARASGMLIPKDQGLAPLEVTWHRVEVDVQDGTSVTKVEQSFRNNTGRQLEATYVFPVPPGAALDGFALYINGKRTPGEVLERNKARGIYEDIVRRMKDPGLVEWLGNDLFQARVFPVPAHGDQRVEIAFSQVLEHDAGMYKYTYPLKTPRAAVQTRNDFTLTLKLHSKAPIRTVFSPSHEIYARKKDDHLATVGFEQERAVLDRDFVMYYSVSQKDVGLNLLTYREKGEPGYFLLMASPKATYESKEILGKSVTFVVDTSGSMAGAKMDYSKAALRYCLKHLDPRDEFNVIRFSSDVEPWRASLQRASSDNVGAALAFVDQLEPAGGTAIHEALTAALSTTPAGPHMVLFITDGRPTVGETDPAQILEEVRKRNEKSARVFAFGVGDDLNTHLLDLLTDQNGGVTSYVREDKEIETRISRFYDKVSHPALTDVGLEIGGVKTYAVLPKRLPDLFHGGQLLVVGRYRDAGDSLVRLTGQLDRQTVHFDFEGTFPGESKKNAFIARLWAQRQVGYLLDEIRLRGETSELRDEVIQLATRFGIVTPYTSYLVVEPTTPVARPDANRPVRMEQPWGAGGRTVGGLPSRDGDASGPGESASRAPSAAPRPAAEAEDAPMDALADERSFRAKEGKAAVSSAKAVQGMKTSTTVSEDDGAGIRYVGGRTFQWKSGRWVDKAWSSSLQTIKVKYLSAAYFELLKEIPDLGQYLALGDRVTLVRGSRALEIDATGKEALSRAEIDSLR